MENEVLFAGAACVDITPERLPVICNGEFVSRLIDVVEDPLSVSAIVFKRGEVEFAMAVVDTCMIPDWIHDKARELVAQKTGLRTDRVLISATHCHSAPSLIGILGSDPDVDYAATIPEKIAAAIATAKSHLVPAKIGFGAGADPNNVYCRRFIMQPGTAWTVDQALTGSRGDIAQMNPFDNHDKIVCRTGQPDPTVSVLSVVTEDGRPLAVFGNYSTHYAGAEFLSADYFGVFRKRMKELIGADDDFVAIMSNGTSGDTNCIDFLHLDRKYDRFTVGESVSQAAFGAWKAIEYNASPLIDMMERPIELGIRQPTAEQLNHAREVCKSFEGRLPETFAEVYARECLYLADMPSRRSVRLQAIRLGELGIAAIPAEVYTFTGRELRAASAFENTFTISLANGSNGYLPTEESFELGGYTTWRARTSCLEETAERKIRNTMIKMLDQLACK